MMYNDTEVTDKDKDRSTEKQASLDPDQNIIDEVALTGQEKPAIDLAPSTDFSGYDAGGFDPAPSPDF